MKDLVLYIRALRGPIVVLGGSGFIGSNLFKTIAAHRDDVYAIEHGAHSWRLDGERRDRILHLDVTDKSAIKHLLETLEPQTILDCAGYGGFPHESDAERIFRTNLNAIVALTELLAERPFSAYVHAGSSSEYGANSAAPAESDALAPNSAYAASKAAAAHYLHFLGKHRAFPCVNLRLYSVYGPMEDTSRLIPSILRAALEDRFPDLVDASISRDFVFVDDVCAAFVLAAAKMNPALFGESINIGTGTKTTIGELAGLVGRAFCVAAEPRFGAMANRSWDIADWYADPRKARELLDWRAEVSLEDGLRTTLAWVKQLDQRQFDEVSNKRERQASRSISAIVACYKDARAIPVMYERLTKTFTRLGIDYEIIFVDDGSPDDDARAIRAVTAEDSRVIGIAHSRNFGSQMAFRSGMELATKDAVVLLDGDLQDPPELIEAFYERWMEGFDVVYGRRTKREMPAPWEFLHKLFYRAFSAFSYVPMPLDAGDFSLMDRKVVAWLLACGERDMFVRGLRAYVGFRQTGVDYRRPKRAFGTSTNNLRRNIEWAKRGIFSFSNAPLTMLTTAGVTLFAISLVAAFVEALLRLFVPGIAPRGVTTIVIAILFFGSINLFAIGLVGEYVAKIMTEVKQRPRLIRAALLRGGERVELARDEGPR